MKRANLTLGALVLSCGTALAGGPANPPPPKESKDMDCLVGNWKGAGTVKMGDQTANLKATFDCKRTAGAWALECRMRATGMPGMASYEESDLFAWDANLGKYHWYSVTNAGETHDHLAAAPTGEELSWVYTGTQEGKPFKELVKFTFGPQSKTLDVTCEALVDGKQVSLMTINAKK